MKITRRKLVGLLPASLLLGGTAIASNKKAKEDGVLVKNGTFLTPQSYGIEPGDKVYGEEMARLISAGGDISFITPGVYLTDRTLVIPSSTRIWIGNGVKIKLADNSNCNIFQNKAYHENSEKPDQRIEISGSGEIDFNGKNQKTSGLTHMCSILKNIESLYIGGGLKVINANKYAWLVAQVDKLTVDGLDFDTFSDGLHCQSPINHAFIRNLKGKTGDDMLAFTIGDYANYDISERGDFSNIDVAGLFCESALCAVKITGNGSGVFDKFRITGIYGKTQHAVFRVWGDTNLLSTVIRSITVEDIHATPADGYPVVDIDDRNFASGEFGIEIQSASFRNIYNSSPDEQTVRISSTVGTMIHNLHIENPPRKTIGVIGVNHKSSIISNLTVCNGYTEFIDDSNSSIVLNRGTIERMVIDNYKAKFPNSKNGSIARMIGACRVDEAIFSGVLQENGVSGWININAGIPTASNLSIVNYTCNGRGRLAQVFSSKLLLNIKNSKVINGNPSDKLFYVNGGEMTILGDIDCDYNTVAADNGGVIKTASGINNICCDVSLLNAKESSIVINTNNSLPCGLGLVIFSGEVWKNLASGNTYKVNK
jgi:hypothetical protein